jgi:murein DD-endopeptidase MepM/ murein hydrolase activator NlpD
MGCVDEPERSLSWSRWVIFAAIAVGAAGCSSETSRFENPFEQFENPFASRAAQPTNEVTGSVHAKTSSVQSSPLPPPNSAAMQPPGSQPAMTSMAGGGPGGASYPTPYAAQPQRSGWNGEGGTVVTVAPGETAASLSRRYGVPVAGILQANNLPDAAAIKPGQRLMIPRHEATGSVNAQRVASNAPVASASHVHVIGPGETLMKLSRHYNKPLSAIARANNLPTNAMVKVGDRIVIPGVRPQRSAAGPAAAPAATPASQVKPPAVTPAVQPQKPAPVTKVAAAPVTSTARTITPVDEKAAPEKAKAEVAAAPTFRWPVRGRIIASFGPKTSGQQNDGINVAVPEGTPIKASEDGVVAYAGNELKTYGNLVLVRHSNGYVTAYAHASEILVKRDDPIKRGQVIAKSGQSGSVSAPQLHFEIRKGSSPIDPLPLLEKGGNT